MAFFRLQYAYAGVSAHRPAMSAIPTSKRSGIRHFPLSTFIINVIAGLLAGIVAALSMKSAISGDVHFLLATGFLGGFSTFSTMMNEAVILLRKGETTVFAAYLAVSVIVPIVSVACGYLMV